MARDTIHAVRLGLRQIKGLSQGAAEAIVRARPPGGFRDVGDLARRTGLGRGVLEVLAEADALRGLSLRGLGLDRRAALWAVKALGDTELPLFAAAGAPTTGPEPAVDLPAMTAGEHVVEDYARLRLSLKTHPMALLRARIAALVDAGAPVPSAGPHGTGAGGRHPRHMPSALVRGAPAPSRTPLPPAGEGGTRPQDGRVRAPRASGAGAPRIRASGPRFPLVPASALASLPHGRRVAVAGLVLVRQRPGSAKGVVFITLEDETGVANLVVLPPVFETFRKPILSARLLLCHGRVERQEEVIHVRVERLDDVSACLHELLVEPAEADGALSRGDWAGAAMARADEVKRPTPDQREEKATTRHFPDGRNFR